MASDDRRGRGIVILGHPRSGTTLLRRLLDGHSRIACPPETHLLSACARFLEAERTADGVDMGVLAGLNFAGFDDAEVLAKLRDFAFAFLADFARRQNKPRWAEKTAFDAFHIEAIERLCGDRVLYLGIVRHGLDVAISCKDFCDATGLYPKPLHDYIRLYAQPIEAFAHSWSEVNERLFAFAERHVESCLVCRYEDLVEDPQGTLADLLEFLGESFEPAMLERGLGNLDQLGFSDHKSYQAREVHKASTARWQSLPEPQVQHLAPLLNPLLEKCGYDRLESGAEITTEDARRRYAMSLMVHATRGAPQDETEG